MNPANGLGRLFYQINYELTEVAENAAYFRALFTELPNADELEII